MLELLHVKNLALIEETEVTFGPGLNILTGETGAGKSILLGALGLALGQKAQAGFLRTGQTEALVEAVFSLTPIEEKKLSELEIEPEDGRIILSRKVSETKSTGRINGEMVPLSKLKSVAEILLDIHGQHEHQSLLSVAKHLEILDAYCEGEIGELKGRVSESVTAYNRLKKELEGANTDEKGREKDILFLQHEIEEIENARLVPGEDESLEEEYKRLTHAEKIREALSETYELVCGDMGASSLAERASKRLDSVAAYDGGLSDILSSVNSAAEILNDAAREIDSYMRDYEDEGRALYETEERLNLINHLKSKYGRTIEDILSALSERQEELSKLSDYDSYLADLRARKEKAEKEAYALCEKLSAVRRKNAELLCANIKKNLLDLNFMGAEISMEFEETQMGLNGFDRAAFMISVNPGEPVRRLDKIASGGEMSRIMLAIKTVLASEDEIGTLIFDEIDTGISGRTATAVAEKMNVISGSHQVICITHLPQIASMADSHFLIEKSVRSESTISDIKLLTDEESVMELTRMLGGDSKEDPAYANALDMKTKAMEKKGL